MRVVEVVAGCGGWWVVLVALVIVSVRAVGISVRFGAVDVSISSCVEFGRWVLFIVLPYC